MNNSNKNKNVYYLLLSYFNLTLQCTTSQISQTYLKNSCSECWKIFKVCSELQNLCATRAHIHKTKLTYVSLKSDVRACTLNIAIIIIRGVQNSLCLQYNALYSANVLAPLIVIHSTTSET